MWYASGLRSYLGARNRANRSSRRSGQLESRKQNHGALHLIVQGVKGPFAVGECEDPVVTDEVLLCHSAHGTSELVDMALHAHLTDQGSHVLASMGARSTLVIA